MKEFDEFLISIANEITEFRKLNNMTQRELAKALKVNPSIISQIEHKQNMTLSTIWKLSKVLGFEFGIRSKAPNLPANFKQIGKNWNIPI